MRRNGGKSAGKTRRSLRLNILLLVLACGLLVGGTIGTARAVPLIESQFFSAGVETYEIGVTLVENGSAVSSRNYVTNSNYVWEEGYGVLLGNLVKSGESFQLGRVYPEALTVQNSGRIDEYVRVNLYRYWVDKNGNKVQSLSPDMIDLHLVTGNGWVVDEASSTTERTVLYYTKVLPTGGTTPAFTDTLTVSGQLPYLVTPSTKDNVITTTYDYEGVSFQVEAEVDAVQTHSPEAAIWSAWGRQVTVTDGNITLK